MQLLLSAHADRPGTMRRALCRSLADMLPPAIGEDGKPVRQCSSGPVHPVAGWSPAAIALSIRSCSFYCLHMQTVREDGDRVAVL